jgi:hypothetical protein
VALLPDGDGVSVHMANRRGGERKSFTWQVFNRA